MSLSFRKHHLLSILNEFSLKNIPLDLFLKNYFKKNKSVGSKDRKDICENLYKIIRWKGLLDFLLEKPITNEKRIENLDVFEPLNHLEDKNIEPHIRVSFPKDYFEKLKNDFSLEKAIEFCLISNDTAPTTIRANLLKINRDDLYNLLKVKYEVEKCKKSPYGIKFNKKINFFDSVEFKNGLFEIQDEASQLVADLINPSPKDHILDYCAGSGGKTLSFAHKLTDSNQIYLHDKRDYVLIEAKKRLKRAAVKNFQIKPTLELNKINQKMDWLILDVPCSGSGTIRRNPDLKWKFNLNELQKLTDLQKEIFDKGINFLKKNGKILYITCSIFIDENQNQIDYFVKKYNLKIEKTFSSFPEKGLHDGFFAAVLSN
ncbi:MAG: RsmB/NOP family class I SAM-dependent RNA methyltransferase [Parachlamydiales bacterium]|jgi:16S rRNA C967 or C1407 C5-methylase (RsmB/RsmF family)